jgi:predicted metal-dependent phosphoesterase TrpH
LGLIRTTLIAALLAGVGVGCTAHQTDQWQVRWCAAQERLHAEQQRDPLAAKSVLRGVGFGLDKGLFSLDYTSELQRLFLSGPGDDKPSARRIITKALLAIPLMNSENSLEMVVRPERDIVMTLGRRLVVRKYNQKPPIVPSDGTIAVDTHVHTCGSPDSLSSASEMLLAAAKRGLAGVAITDHDSFDGARRAVTAARKLISQGRLPAGFFVIPGQEVSSSQGHIIALFLTDDIPGGRSAESTVRAIHAQGGLAIAAHPMLPDGLHDLANTLPFDAVETESASEKLHYAITPYQNQEARVAFYATVTKPRLGASDSHDPETMAECYTLARCAATPEAFREAILAGHTQAMATVSDAEERSIVRRPTLRLLSTYRSVVDLSPIVRKFFGSDSIRLSVLPRPEVLFSREF